ncbi:hypothetical protein V6N13_044714 [Hibiscus sabdariffa]|uniref:RNase III domain-containing protein n=1 Tax=Hibiscus sabdariffa TaxID=183260 RepID=A0ABR2RJF1_9ROSI
MELSSSLTPFPKKLSEISFSSSLSPSPLQLCQKPSKPIKLRVKKVHSCLPSKLNNADQTWIDEYLLEAKQALGTNARHVRSAHSRLSFLGQYVLELALVEFFLQRYPRESPGPMRERVFGLIGKRNLPKWIKAASLQYLIFTYDDMDKLIRKDREPPVKSVFWALFGAIYLCFGMPEVYCVLFEVFGMDPEAEDCQPRLRRQLEDVDYVSVEFEGNKLSWQDVATYKASFDFLTLHL